MRAACTTLLLVLLAAACSSSNAETSAPASATSGLSSTTGGTLQATTGSTTISATTGSGPANDAEPDLRFDIGVVAETGATDGTPWIRFDRFQFGDRQGTELTEEPRYELATDACCRNDNPRLRIYVLAEGVEVLRIDPAAFDTVCAGDFDHPYDFETTELGPLLADGGLFASLTFDEEGRVIRIREQTGC